jgi:hypothetical protein
MTQRSKDADGTDEVRLDDGAATQRLREIEKRTVISRRGVLWRAGLVTAAGVGMLTALDPQQADAATGGPLLLGQVNNSSAGDTTTLESDAATTGLASFLMTLDGTNTTATTLVVKGAPGGKAIDAQAQSSGTGVSGTGTSGAGVSGSSSSGSGVSGQSTSGAGVSGSSSTGAGIDATSTGGGPALRVTGTTQFSRSGSASVATGHQTKSVIVPGMTASSLVLVTLQVAIAGVYVEGAVPGNGKFIVNLNAAAPSSVRFAWFALSG